jgi:hypothetical protein
MIRKNLHDWMPTKIFWAQLMVNLLFLTLSLLDESWCFQYDPEMKREIGKWQSPSCKTKKVCFHKSHIKTMLSTLFDYKMIIGKEFVAERRTVSSKY